MPVINIFFLGHKRYDVTRSVPFTFAVSIYNIGDAPFSVCIRVKKESAITIQIQLVCDSVVFGYN
jgi:hypothetical protein